MAKQQISSVKKFDNLKCATSADNIFKNGKNIFAAAQSLTNFDAVAKNEKHQPKSDKTFTKGQKILLLLSGGIIGFLNGFFGGGGGMICVPILQKVLSLDEKHSHATAIAVIFPLSLISAAVYVFNGAISSLPLLTVGLGVVLGGILGAYALKFLPPKALRLIFAIIMFLGGIKLIL